MNELKNKRIIISGLISSKVNLDVFLSPIKNMIIENDGELIDIFIQRRGVSKSNKPGGSKLLNLPLNRQTYISSGKVEELKELALNKNCNLILFINELTKNQHTNLETLVGVKICTMPPTSHKNQ